MPARLRSPQNTVALAARAQTMPLHLPRRARCRGGGVYVLEISALLPLGRPAAPGAVSSHGFIGQRAVAGAAEEGGGG